MLDYLPGALTYLAFGLHALGDRRGRRRDRTARLRAVSFYAGLATILIALSPPVDGPADQLFWAHMIQHLLLLNVAAPLIALGRPWMSMWRSLPLGWRRTLARTVVRSPGLAPVRALFGAVTRPVGAWLSFTLSLLFWHLPGPYDLTLRDNTVHILEHTSFLLFGVVFWTQVTASPRARAALSSAGRIIYLAAAMVANIGLSMYLAFAQHPLYAPYAELAHRPGGISALADQQIGAGLMWTAGDMPFAIAIALLVHRWLAEDDVPTTRLGTAVAGLLSGER